MWQNYEFSKYYVIFIYFQAAVSALFWLSQFCTLKKNRNRLREYSKIRNFVTYQITFLMTCQQHKEWKKNTFKLIFIVTISQGKSRDSSARNILYSWRMAWFLDCILNFRILASTKLVGKCWLRPVSIQHFLMLLLLGTASYGLIWTISIIAEPSCKNLTKNY